MNFKEIHIGTLINQAITEQGIAMSRICNFEVPRKERMKPKVRYRNPFAMEQTLRV